MNSEETSMASTNELNIAELKERYREERDKRLRADGNSQYIRIEGQLSHYLEDPYTPVSHERRRRPRTFILRRSFAGLVTGARLKS